jgi:hypothetical protein
MLTLIVQITIGSKRNVNFVLFVFSLSIYICFASSLLKHNIIFRFVMSHHISHIYQRHQCMIMSWLAVMYDTKYYQNNYLWYFIHKRTVKIVIFCFHKKNDL